MSNAATTAKKLMTAEEFGDWVHQPERANKWFELVRGEVPLEENQELTGEDILPGFRCRVVDFFSLPGERAKRAQQPE
jgi:hypothetical protein